MYSGHFSGGNLGSVEERAIVFMANDDSTSEPTKLRRNRLVLALVCWLAFAVSGPVEAQSPQENPAPNAAPKIVVNVNKVLVPVVVRDKKGNAVGDLQKDAFRVFDEGKRQVITGFTIEKRSAVQNATQSGTLKPDAASGTHPPATAAQFRFIVLLFDNLHLGNEDLMQVQHAAKKMLENSLGPLDYAAVAAVSGANSGLTRDHDKLEQAIASLKTHNLFESKGYSCPSIDYYKADLIQNKQDRAAFDEATQEALTCAHLDERTMRKEAEQMVRSAVTRALAQGEQSSRTTLEVIAEFVRRMGALQGQRMLILVSPGFLTLEPGTTGDKSHILDLAAQANVTISVLDARGLYTTQLDASVGGMSSAQLLTASVMRNHSDAMVASEDVMAELAEGSGGTYFHNSNDLEGGFRELAAMPEYVYLLEFSLQKRKPDGKFHRLKVTVDQDGLQVQARRGYFEAKGAKN